MYEKEIQFITDFNLNKIKKLGSFITFDKLFTADLHPAIIQYISAELDYLIYEDKSRLLEKSAFDYSGSKIAEYFSLIGQEIKKTKKISYEDIKKIIIQAVSFNANFTVRPKWSLIRLIYNDSESKEVHEIKMMLSYVYYYEYLKDVFLTYLNRRKVISLSQGEFELILNKIDNELFSTQAEKLIDNALYSIADFYNEGGISRKSLPVPLFETFLKEKNLPDYLFRLRKAAPAETKHKIEIEELRKILFSTTPIEKEKQDITENEIIPPDEKIIPEDAAVELDDEKEEKMETGEDKTEIIEIDKQGVSDEFPSSKIEEEILDSDMEKTGEKTHLEDADTILSLPEDEPKIISDEEEIKFDITEKDKLETLYDFEEEDREKETEKIEEIKEEETTPLQDKKEEIKEEEILEIEEESKSIEEELIENEIVNQIEESEIEEIIEEDIKPNPTPKSKGKDIFSFLSDKEIEKIIGSIFNEDREDFANTMEKISECTSYNESTDILKAVFFTYRISPYSKEAVSLTNAVANYFSQAD